MNINVICIGKLKEKYWQDAAAEYIKRLGAFCNVKIVELKEARLPQNASASDEARVIREEGEAILGKLDKADYVVALAIEGKSIDSPELSRLIGEIFGGEKDGRSYRTVDFIIGGSLGLSDEVKKRANYLLSFSRMTFPHQLARVLLLEQIYRAFKISAGETYHK